ncbi:MAG: rod shape-determining protein MreC [Alphaproteobacteria bacterium]|nr:rod shape-determining protein MreC [Alphaproteobacteria bacterium]
MFLIPTKRLLRRRDRSAGKRWRLFAGLLLLAAGAILFAAGQLFPGEVADARSRLAGPVSSILAIAQAPLKPLFGLRQRYDDFLDTESELARLRADNEELKGWQWRALELERQLADLSALNRVVNEPGLDYVTTRVLARSIGAGSRSVLIGAGKRAGVPAGAAVINQRGLVGVTYEVGPATSRVLYINDARAAVLVSIGRGLVTAEVAGTGGAYLDIRDGGRSFDIAVGDEVMTAGEAGGMPRGLRVGRVVTTSQGLRVVPYVDFDRLEFVSVLVPGGREADGPKGADRGGSAHLTAELQKAGDVLVAAPAAAGADAPDPSRQVRPAAE